MEKHRPTQQFDSLPSAETTSVYKALDNQTERQILDNFTPEQQIEISKKLAILGPIAQFIGKDFRMPVELNQPGEGWHWDFKANIVRVDPVDLLEKPLEYLRFVISHEGGHRRISRTDFIPADEWQQPGFAFMMNAIEDPRDNNFVAEAYPTFRQQMRIAYQADLDFEKNAKQKASQRLGFQPRFMQAGFEYIKQWFREIENKDFDLSTDLPEEVKSAVAATMEAARDSWVRFPTKQMADGQQQDELGLSGEESIVAHATMSYQINRDQIWPEFQKLVALDLEDQATQEFMKDLQKEHADSGRENGFELPTELKDKLTPAEQLALEEALQNAIDKSKNDSEGDVAEGQGTTGTSESQDIVAGYSTSKVINIDSLSPELRQKIKDYIDSLSEAQRKEISDKARQAMRDFEINLNDELRGKMSDYPENKVQRAVDQSSDNIKTPQNDEPASASASGGERVTGGKPSASITKVLGERVFSKKLAAMEREENAYEKYRRDLIPQINQLEEELRQILLDHQSATWQRGFKGGKRIDIKRRIQEKAKDVPVMESRAWERRERPEEIDLAISLLVDISGSMYWNDKSKEALKLVIVLAEALNRLGVHIEILGFNDEITQYQTFGEAMSKTVRQHIGEIINDASSKRCNSCPMDHCATDIGWATEMAAERLDKQKAGQKLLFTLSDYQFEESPQHPASKYELSEITNRIINDKNISSVGLGVGKGTEHVALFYHDSIANLTVNEVVKKLVNLIKKLLAN